MKGYKVIKPQTIKEVEFDEPNIETSKTKVKIKKTLLTLADAVKYTEESEEPDKVLGSYGMGIVSDSEANLFDIEKGKHVYIEAYLPCNECYNCKSGDKNKCLNLLTPGEDYDGFLCDFYTSNSEKIFVLPESVSDYESLFIGEISLAISIVHKLNLQKGDYVSIVGGNNLANILAQLLIYYQAVPILLTNDDEDAEIAKNAGIYYVLGQNDNWQKEVSNITGGRMTEKVVYLTDCNIPAIKAFSLASYNARVVFTGNLPKNNSFSFTQAIKKQLNIYCINIGVGNTESSINLIANKAIDLSHLKVATAKYEEVSKVFKQINEKLEKGEKFYETVITQD